MKRFFSVCAAGILAVAFAGAAYAGPSRALIHETGGTIAKDEVNIDLDVVSTSFNVVGVNDTTLGNGNASVGGTTVSSVNVSLIENLELRIGRLPGFRSYITLPAVAGVALNPAGNNYGLTVKGSVPQVPGLAAWVGYGTTNESDITGNNTNAAADVSGSSKRVGVAYTKVVSVPVVGALVLNGTVGLGKDTGNAAGRSVGTTTTTEAGAAVLYPLRPSLLVGFEFNYAKINVGDDKTNTCVGVANCDRDFNLKVFAPALGARIIQGNWTIDAVLALMGTTIKVDGNPDLGNGLQDTASSTVVGVPALRVNYKF
ncbi:MAG: hypothetical protein HY886_08325 [Deltaproteobacteria bacterium]|nr:hypothetical protein [Deltaproteobacteria bacterium]